MVIFVDVYQNQYSKIILNLPNDFTVKQNDVKKKSGVKLFEMWQSLISIVLARFIKYLINFSDFDWFFYCNLSQVEVSVDESKSIN